MSDGRVYGTEPLEVEQQNAKLEQPSLRPKLALQDWKAGARIADGAVYQMPRPR